MDPRGIRNNNFGNIKDGPFAQGLPGYNGSDGTFATFASPEHGWGAMDKLLAGYGSKGLNTPSSVIGRWAPTSDGNNVGAYAQYVSGQMGVDPSKPLDMSDPQVRSKLARSMANFENGEGPMKSAFAKSPTPAGNTPMPSRADLDQNMLDYQQPTQLPPALSSKALAGPGGMYGLSNGTITKGGEDVYDLSNSMQGAGAWLMGINNPRALGALGALQKQTDANGKYDEKTGTFYAFDKKGKPVITGRNPNWDDAEKRDRQRNYDKASDDQWIKTYGDLQTHGSAAQQDLSLVAQAKDILGRTGADGTPLVYQGFGGELANQAKSFYKSLGGDPQGLSEGQVADAITKQLTLRMKNQGGVNLMPGPQTDRDLQYLSSTASSLGKDPKTNQQLLDTYERTLKRSQDLAGIARQHNGGRLDNSFYDKVSEYDRKQAEDTQRRGVANSYWR